MHLVLGVHNLLPILLTVNLVFLLQLHDKCELMLDIFLPVQMVSLRQKVLFCIIPIIILDGSWVTFIKSQAWGRGLIASINLIQPLRDVVVDGQARPDGGRSSPLVLRSHWFSLAVRNSHGSSLLGLTAGFSDAQLDCLTWILRHGTLIRFVQRCDIAIDPLIWCECICAVRVLFLALL